MHLMITGAWEDAQNHISGIESNGHSTVFMKNEADTLPCEYAWPEGIICNGLFLHHDIEKFVNLKYIQLTSAGYDRAPMDFIRKHNIEIHNAGGVYSIPMAEFAVCGVLQLYKKSNFFWNLQNSRKWEKNRSLLELYGKTVCIIGCGSVGTECAKRFDAFGCNVVGVDFRCHEDRSFKYIEKPDKLDDNLKIADVVIIALPLTDSTYHFIDFKKLKLLRRTAILVNISRGGILDTDAFIRALPNIGGAVLDVFEEEPLKEDSPLWNEKNVIITPHNSFIGDGNNARLNTLIINNLYNRA